MRPDVTVHITFGSGGATASTSSQAGGASETRTDPPPPLPLERLQIGGAQSAPTPVAPEELAASQPGIRAEAGSPPPPMPIERLMQSRVASAPTPLDLTALSFGSGPPAPRPLAELGDLLTGSPVPMHPDQLGVPGSGPGPDTPRRRDK